jgi:glycosyltransferase involved in cell wall biosynthesis
MGWKLSVVVPVYNEHETIGPVLQRVLAVPLGEALTGQAGKPVEKEVIVVDDGSTDGTGQVLDAISDERVRVIHQPRNMGKGTSIRTALEHVTGDAVIIKDADAEYNPEDYGRLLEPVASGRADLVYGSRFLGRVEGPAVTLRVPQGHPEQSRGVRKPEGMRFANRVFNRVIAALARILFRFPLTDEATCYKLFRTDVIKSLPLRCQRFEFCPEVTAKALKRGWRLVETPITYRARGKKEGKKIGWRDGVEALWTLVKYRFVD